MTHKAFLTRKSSPRTGLALSLVFALTMVMNLYPSDLSDAEMLRDRCDREFTELQVPARNFGDKADLDRLNEGAALIKDGKVKLLQSKYLEASASFNKYLGLQQLLYKSLADKYISRTGKWPTIPRSIWSTAMSRRSWNT
jgi:hypothetical protein